MAYRIRYISFGEEKKAEGRRNWKTLLAGLLVAMLLIGAMFVKIGELPFVMEYLLPGDPSVTAAALDGMVEDLKEGESIKNAVTAFCREIIEHAPTDPA